MEVEEDEGMIVLGADTHKRSHTIAAVAAAAGELLGEQTIAVDRQRVWRAVAVGAQPRWRPCVGA
jgi:hypothetical protein